VPPALALESTIKFAMNPQFRFDRDNQPHFQFKRADHRGYYSDVALSILLSVARHRRLIASLVAVAVVFAGIVTPLMPRRYSAEALIQPSLVSREQGKPVPLASVDGAAIVTGEARLIRSDAILREVAKRLEQGPVALGSRSLSATSSDWFWATWFPEKHNHSPLDRLVALLRNKVVIMNDTRSYLISVSFTGPSAEDAAQVVNAVAVEYLRDKEKQRRLEKVISAEAELRQQLALYGEKHPKTVLAATELDAERALLDALVNSQYSDQNANASEQSVKFAVPNYTPTSPKGVVIFGLSVFSALLAGIGLAIWRDRKQSHEMRSEVEKIVGRQPNPEKVKRKQPTG